jgi:hypothetical protein
VYAVGRPPVTPFEHASAAVLACGWLAALSHASAMTLWGLWRRWGRPFEVTIPSGDRRPKGITVHRSTTLKPYDSQLHHGIRVTKPARAILDIAPRLTDDRLARTVNRGLHEHILYLGSLGEQLIRHPNHPATKRLMTFVITTDGPTDSDWEYAFPAFCENYDLPKPIMRARVAGHRVDALFETEGLIIELDSWEFHNTRLDFETDRDRDFDTLVIADHPTVRITWNRMIKKTQQTADGLHTILQRLRQRRAA